MAQNMGFGSAVTGFGTGYLNALRQGRSEQSSLLSAKLRKDALEQKKQEATAAGSLRALQMEDLIDARRDRRDAAKDRTANATNKLLFGANAKVSDFYAKMQPVIATMDPAQRKTTQDSMRASVRGMLVAGGMKPEDADGYAESLIKPYGAALQDEMVDVPVAPNMEKEGLLSRGIIPESSVGSLGAQTPELGQATPFSLQPDGTYGRVGKFAMDPTLRNMAGMVEVLKSNPAQLAYNASQGGMKPQEGFSQFAPSAYGATEQRSALTEQMPATATYGIDLKNQSLIGKNNASTELTKVRTQQLVDLFPDQAAFLKKKVEALGAGIENTKTRTKFMGLNYDLELRKLAAQTAHQNAMTAIQGGQLGVAQQNLALRQVGLRMKAIIDPNRIGANAGAIIADLTQAKGKLPKGASSAVLDQQIARMQQLQKNMKTFEIMSTQSPQDLANANKLAQVLGEGMQGLGILGQLSGVSPDTDAMRMQLYGGMAPQSAFEDPFMTDDDYYGEQDAFGNHPLAYPGQAARAFNTGGTGSRPMSPNGMGIPFR